MQFSVSGKFDTSNNGTGKMALMAK